MKKIFQKTKEYFMSHRNDVTVLLLAVLNAGIIYYCLELGNKNPFLNGVLYTVINILTVFVVMAAVYVFVQRWWISSLVVAVPAVGLSIANYYTLIYRNSPISTQDIHNVGTTLSVIDGYKFPITLSVAVIVVLFVVLLCVTWRIRRAEKGKKLTLKGFLAKNVCLLVFGTTFLYSVYFAEESIKPKNTFVWSWEDSYYKYGYAASSIEIFQKSMNVVTMPDGYSEETLEAAVKENEISKGGENTPDIIFILNETFYDLRDIVELESESAMPFWDSLPDSQKGKMVVAGTGGGTNKSEYEFLSSNTLQLMPGITPFNYLEFKESKGIVSYLEDLGYTTWGAHCANSVNYSRGKVYPEMGFDKIMFLDDFGQIEKYGERPYASDEFCYNQLIEDYEKMGEGPRFMYLLTIQNHGGWELNPEDENLVNETGDFGEYTDDVSEFLSCIKTSDMAFEKLTEYFSKSERPVIICMVGDHAPSFAVELVSNIDKEKTFKLRSTPYAVWANFEIDEELPDTTSMPYAAPMVLAAADCPLSPFYGYMSEMQKEVPVLTAFGLYRTADGAEYKYSDTSPYKKTVDTYFDMVYNNASTDANRIPALFEPMK